MHCLILPCFSCKSAKIIALGNIPNKIPIIDSSLPEFGSVHLCAGIFFILKKEETRPGNSDANVSMCAHVVA